MSLQVSVAVTIADETGATLIQVGRSESVLPMETGGEVARASGERAARLIGEAADEVARQIVHLRSLMGEDAP